MARLKVPNFTVHVFQRFGVNLGGQKDTFYCIEPKCRLMRRTNSCVRMFVGLQAVKRMLQRYEGGDGDADSSELDRGEDDGAAKLLESAQDCSNALPGLGNVSFLTDLCNALTRKYELRVKDLGMPAPSSLYVLWSLCSSVTTELFADCFSESELLPNYCSLYLDDSKFGSIGKWQDVEHCIEGGGGHPPSDRALISQAITEFDKGARNLTPYCRCVLLPLSKDYDTLERTLSISSKGVLLVRIPPFTLPFDCPHALHKPGSLIPQYHPQELGLFVWVNREYMVKYPPPKDFDLIYMHWIYRTCKEPSQVQLYVRAFEEAFPRSLRSSESRVHSFTS